MRFSEFFDSWLYGRDGYYENFKTIGKEGDFYTAVSATNFFGASIANQIYKQIKAGSTPTDVTLIEIGAHQGYLLCDMIQWLYTCDPSLMESMDFAIVERQPKVQKMQKEYIKERFGNDIQITHYSDLSEISVTNAFYVANEIFDAFACELVYDNKIAVIDEDTLHHRWIDNDDEALKATAKRYGIEKGEVAVGFEVFAQTMFRTAKHVEFITFDYGEKHPRNDFSVRIYKDHEVFPFFENGLDIIKLYKQSDITMDVHFGHLMGAFEDAGFQIVTFANQNSALVEFGLMDILQSYAKVSTQQQYLRQLNRIKTLIEPTMMGERFKMMQVKKDKQ